jgi:hypothetical protein
MNPAQASFTARPVAGILITNEGRTHDAAQWAGAVTNGIVTIAPDATPERRAMGEELRRKLRGLFRKVFSEVGVTSSAASIDKLTHECMSVLTELFLPTPWAESVTLPLIRDEIARYIRANLFDAANLALTTE